MSSRICATNVSMVQALFVSRQEQVAELLGAHAKPSRIKARLVNFKESTTVIRLLKSSAIGLSSPAMHDCLAPAQHFLLKFSPSPTFVKGGAHCVQT